MPGKPAHKSKKVEQPQNFFPVNIGLIPAPDTIPINTRGTFVDLETGKKKRSQFRGFVTTPGTNIKWWTFVNSGKTNDNMFKKMDMLHAVKANPAYASRWEFLVEPEFEAGPAPAPAPEGGAGPAEEVGDVPNWFRRHNVPYAPAHNELVLPNAAPEVSPVSTTNSLELSNNSLTNENVLKLLNSPARKSRRYRRTKNRKATRRSRRS